MQELVGSYLHDFIGPQCLLLWLNISLRKKSYSRGIRHHLFCSHPHIVARENYKTTCSSNIQHVFTEKKHNKNEYLYIIGVLLFDPYETMALNFVVQGTHEIN